LPLDRVKTLEDRIDRVALQLAERTKRVVRKVYPRKIFSEPVPLKDRAEEWRLMDEAYAVDIAVEAIESLGIAPENWRPAIRQREREATNGKASHTNPPSVDDSSGGMGALYP
jgi:hypothetical protein